MGNVGTLTPLMTGRINLELVGKYQNSSMPNVLIFSAKMSSSYATAGDTLDLSSYITGVPTGVLCFTSTNGYLLTYVAGTTAANGKVKAFSAEGVQVTAATDLSAETFFMIVLGAQMLLS